MVVTVAVDPTKGTALPAAEKSIVEYIESASYSTSSSSSSSEDCRTAVAKSRKPRGFKALFRRHVAHERVSSPPSSPITDCSSPATSPGKKSILHDVYASKIGRKPAVESESNLSAKYGVREKGYIGKGATAVVRLAHKPGCAKFYAIKEFRQRRRNETEKQYIKKLTSEFCISSSLHHPNIVETIDLVKDEKGAWVQVMEYVPTDMYCIIKSGQIGSSEINCCFKQLVRGVAYMHSMGVAHRDIKPENLLMNKHGQLKITDFGVAEVFRISWEKQARLSAGLCGSEPYIAPEQFNRNEYNAQLVDIWSIGIVYYCMAFQGIPFLLAKPSDENYAHYIEARATRSYSPFSKLPKPCRDLLYRILEPNPKKRITMAEILENEWFKSIEVCSDCETSSGEHYHVPATCLPTLPKLQCQHRHQNSSYLS